MSMKLFTVTIVSCETGSEYEVIRQALESCSIRVINEAVGRPQDFIDFLSGEGYFSSDFVIFSFHGMDGKFCMPELGERVYFDNEPRTDFGIEEIQTYCQIKTPVMINMGCGLGYQALADAFLEKHTNVYIGAEDVIDGLSSNFFVIRFFYEHCQNKRSLREAFQLARNTDPETMLFRWFD